MGVSSSSPFFLIDDRLSSLAVSSPVLEREKGCASTEGRRGEATRRSLGSALSFFEGRTKEGRRKRVKAKREARAEFFFLRSPSAPYSVSSLFSFLHFKSTFFPARRLQSCRTGSLNVRFESREHPRALLRRQPSLRARERASEEAGLDSSKPPHFFFDQPSSSSVVLQSSPFPCSAPPPSPLTLI